jgi:hypothetical protein
VTATTKPANYQSLKPCAKFKCEQLRHKQYILKFKSTENNHVNVNSRLQNDTTVLS